MEVISYRELADYLRARAEDITLVAVDAGGGSGKSTFSDRLAKAADASVLHVDDFGSFEAAYDVERLLREAVEPLAAGRDARYRPWDWWERRFGAPKEVPTRPVVIVEGISSGRSEIRPYVSFLVWVETPASVRLERGLERDGVEALPMWEKWMRWENEYARRERPRERADLVVDGAPEAAHDPLTEFIALGGKALTALRNDRS